MTLDEAIRHAEEVAKENEEWYMENPSILGYQEKFYDCKECADEHRQLAEWLKELKRLKEAATDTDTISRRAAIEWCLEGLNNMPSADRNGHWIYGEHEVVMCDGYRCDQCGFHNVGLQSQKSVFY